MELAERSGVRRLNDRTLNLGRQAALLKMKEMYTTHGLHLATSNTADIFATDKIRCNVGSMAKFNSWPTYRLLIENQYKNTKFSATEKFERHGSSFSKKDITYVVKSAETGYLTTKQKRCNLEIFTCSPCTESILAVIDGRIPNKCFVCGVAREKSHVYHVMTA